MSSNHPPFVKTRTAAAQLGRAPCALLSAMYRGKLTLLPTRDESGDLWWSPEAIAAAAVALATDRRRKVLSA